MEERHQEGFLATKDYKNDWNINFGCSFHITGDGLLFSEFRECSRNDAIVTADNSIHPVKNEGSVKIKTGGAKQETITLKSVYHVSHMTKILTAAL